MHPAAALIKTARKQIFNKIIIIDDTRVRESERSEREAEYFCLFLHGAKWSTAKMVMGVLGFSWGRHSLIYRIDIEALVVVSKFENSNGGGKNQTFTWCRIRKFKSVLAVADL